MHSSEHIAVGGPGCASFWSLKTVNDCLRVHTHTQTQCFVKHVIKMPSGWPYRAPYLYSPMTMPAACTRPCSAVQYSTVQYSTVQCSAVQCSAVQCSAVQCSAVQCSAVQCSGVQCSAVQCSAVQCSAVQCSAVQCSAVQCSAVQCSAVQCSAMQCSASYTSASNAYTCEENQGALPIFCVITFTEPPMAMSGHATSCHLMPPHQDASNA